MRDVEAELREILFARAERASPPATMHATLRRARVRQVLTGASAGIALVLLVLAAVTAARVLSDDRQQIAPREDTIQTDGPYGFTSYPREYPTVASGDFRGAEWELTGTRVMRADGLESLHVTLSITNGAQTATKDFFLLGSDEILQTHVVSASDILDGADALFGVTIRDLADTVAVEAAEGDEPTIPAHIFRDYESRSEFTVDFWMAFVPANEPAFVAARDELGADLDVDTYAGASLPPNVIASGRQGETLWFVSFVQGDDHVCFTFYVEDDEGEESCYARQRLETADPAVLVTTIDRPGVLGVIAPLTSGVGTVRLVLEGELPAHLSWREPPNLSDLPKWGFRMVVVGLRPGTNGKLVGYSMSGDEEVVAEEEF